MSTKLKTRTTHTVEIDGVEYSVRLAPENVDQIQSRKLDNGNVVIGYLIQDGDCDNPLENCDGLGSIHSLSRRHRNHISHDEAVSILENDKDTVALSYFEHGPCKWGVNGTMSDMPDFCWDGVSFAGIWQPDDCVRESAPAENRREWMIKQAESACREYTSWCNGECFGVIVVTCDADGNMIDSDECWGFIGHEYAMEELNSQISLAQAS